MKKKTPLGLSICVFRRCFVFLFCLFIQGAWAEETQNIYKMDFSTVRNEWTKKLGNHEMKVVQDPDDLNAHWIELKDDSDAANMAFVHEVDIEGSKKVSLSFVAKPQSESDPQTVMIVFWGTGNKVLKSDSENWVDSRYKVGTYKKTEALYTLSAPVPEGAVRCEVYIVGYVKAISTVWYKDFEIEIQK